MKPIKAQQPPNLSVASFYALLNPESGVLYQERGEIGFVYWEHGVQKKLVLSTAN